mmetsp:Transcript_95287/g.291395  ORF Transcript_95287/g.291395 Transcript_95287/m.291395 type:complete len:243 (+) Transcript_95287:1078-1806(+)
MKVRRTTSHNNSRASSLSGPDFASASSCMCSKSRVLVSLPVSPASTLPKNRCRSCSSRLAGRRFSAADGSGGKAEGEDGVREWSASTPMSAKRCGLTDRLPRWQLGEPGASDRLPSHGSNNAGSHKELLMDLVLAIEKKLLSAAPPAEITLRSRGVACTGSSPARGAALLATLRSMESFSAGFISASNAVRSALKLPAQRASVADSTPKESEEPPFAMTRTMRTDGLNAALPGNCSPHRGSP